MKINSLKNENYGSFSIDNYRPPYNFELVGQTLELVMDDGYDLRLHFADRHTLTWGRLDEEPRTDSYGCLKADEDTYLVNFELAGSSPRTCMTFVLDMENRLVTRIIARCGTNPKLPYLMTTEFTFGAIAREGEPLPFKRHGYTTDMVGNCIEWTYGHDLRTVHVYYSPYYYRITYPRDKKPASEEVSAGEAFNDVLANLPGSDEPAVYIKIKENLYLFSLIEANAERHTPEYIHGSTLCFLMNFDRVYEVGRGFGTGPNLEPVNVMFGSYGRFVDDVDEEMLTGKNPFIV